MVRVEWFARNRQSALYCEKTVLATCQQRPSSSLDSFTRLGAKSFVARTRHIQINQYIPVSFVKDTDREKDHLHP